MSEFVRICSASQLPVAGQVAEFTVNGRPFCVVNVNGAISVMDGTCPHEGGPLGEGIVEDGRVVCPWHGYSFDPRSGSCEQDNSLKAEVLEAAVANEELRAKI